MPGPGGYWLPRPSRMAAAAAAAISGGPSVSGKPWPRLTDPVVRASADISAKIVVPMPVSRRFSNGRSTPPSDHTRRLACPAPARPCCAPIHLVYAAHMGMPMRIALGQLPVSPDPAVNLTRVRLALADAAAGGAGLVVFPEATQARFGTDLRAVAEPLDGPFGRGLAAAARQRGGGPRRGGVRARPGRPGLQHRCRLRRGRPAGRRVPQDPPVRLTGGDRVQGGRPRAPLLSSPSSPGSAWAC